MRSMLAAEAGASPKDQERSSQFAHGAEAYKRMRRVESEMVLVYFIRQCWLIFNKSKLLY